MRPTIEANIEIEDDDPDVIKRFIYLAQYLEGGDGLNIRAGRYTIRTRVTGIEREPDEPTV